MTGHINMPFVEGLIMIISGTKQYTLGLSIWIEFWGVRLILSDEVTCKKRMNLINILRPYFIGVREIMPIIHSINEKWRQSAIIIGFWYIHTLLSLTSHFHSLSLLISLFFSYHITYHISHFFIFSSGLGEIHMWT